MTPPPHSAGPLSGTVVIDLSRALAGPHAGMMLGDLGARVIKVEALTGDETRSWGPPFVGPEDDPQATYFLSCNRNKESITLDLKTDEGRAMLDELIERADVVIENFRTGVMDRLGFAPASLLERNPRLVVLSITGFGHDGPEGGRPGYDQIAQGEGGLMSLTGSGPDDFQRVGVPIADLLAGMYGAFGAVAALAERATTGRGQIVRTSLLAGMVGVHAFQGTRQTVAHETPVPLGNHHPSIAPYGLFRTRDGAVQISVANDGLWRTFCAELGLDPDTAGLSTNAERVAHRPRLIEVVEKAFGKHDSDELLAKLSAAGLPAGRVRNLQQVYDWDQVHAQGLVIDVDHDVLGPIRLPGPPLRFFEAAEGGEHEVTKVDHRPPPTLGADNESVADWLAREATR